MEFFAISTQAQRQTILENIWLSGGNDYNDVARIFYSGGRWLGKCVQCDSWMVAQTRKKMYCSALCKGRAERGWQMYHTECIVCGKSIVSIRKRKYCNRNCCERAYNVRKSCRNVLGSK
jgi:hypothetical protein